MLMEVLSHYFTENGAIFIHILNLFVLGMLLFLFFFARQAGKKWSKINDYLGVITKTVNSVRYGDLSKKVERMELPSTEPLAESRTGTAYQHSRCTCRYLRRRIAKRH